VTPVRNLLLSLSLACFSATAAAQQTLLQCGHLLDVESERILKDQQVLISDGVIQDIGKSIDTPADTVVIDLRQSYCGPGLMDMHVHLFADIGAHGRIRPNSISSSLNTLVGLKNAGEYLRMGFTTVRVMGDMDTHFASIELRNAFEKGMYDGPRMIVAPHALSPLGGHSDEKEVSPDQPFKASGPMVANGVDAIRTAIRREFKYGAQWIKVMATGGVLSPGNDPTVAAFSQEEFAAIVEEVHRHNKKVAAHAHGEPGIRMAVEAGFDSIEHGTQLTKDLARSMAKKGIYYVPTVYVMDAAVVAGEQGRIPPENYAKAKEMAGFHTEAVKHAYQQGVKIVIGSDAVFSKRNAIKEFGALNKHIQNPWYVLRAGTLVAAEMVDESDNLGSITVGKRADIIALPGNPVDDFAELEKVNFVMKDGKVVHTAESL
tara:strand:+ start:179889 stop:181181 length:1293 start_codon:yes stop_codon:yes gene_type:complete